jgi:hypothetical protein
MLREEIEGHPKEYEGLDQETQYQRAHHAIMQIQESLDSARLEERKQNGLLPIEPTQYPKIVFSSGAQHLPRDFADDTGLPAEQLRLWHTANLKRITELNLGH